MKTISVKSSRANYNYYIGKDIWNKCKDVLYNIIAGKKAIIVTDNIVATLYANQIHSIFQDSGAYVNEYIFTNGEMSKNSAVLFDILEKCASAGLSRGDLLIALGGGVATDICGLCASLYMRGIDYISIPTTILCAVDAAIGGKTAVNLIAGKNLCGTYYPPKAIFCDTNTFASLPAEFRKDGYAEIIKYKFIADADLNYINNSIEDIVFRCASIKANFIDHDEFDRGTRRCLNFGHTIAHAIEKCSNYRTSHGKAVAEGMSIITLACEKHGFCPIGTHKQLIYDLSLYNLPFYATFDTTEILSAAKNDKKHNGDEIDICLISDIGKPFIEKMNFSSFGSFISDAVKELKQ